MLKEDLVYAFYGRPSYRGRDDHLPTDLSFTCPVVFVLDPEAVPPPKYAFAFDSGAFVDRRFDAVLDRSMVLLDFHLREEVASAGRVTEAAFGSQEAFFLNRPSAAFAAPPGNFEVEAYSHLVSRSGPLANQLDERATTPEFAFEGGVEIEKAVKAVILPNELYRAPNIGGVFAAKGLRLDPYPFYGASRPSEYHMLIRDLVRQVYVDLGWYSGA